MLADSSPTQMSGPGLRVPSRVVLVGAAVLLAVFVLSATSILFRPEGAAWSAWWPASGVAIGFAARVDRRRLWLAAAAVGVVTAAASLANGREVPLAVGAGAAIAVEVWVGAAILRTRLDRPARLESGADLRRLLACALVASTVGGVLGGVVVAAVRGADGFLPVVIATIPSHTVGILIVAPLIIRRRPEVGAAGLGETFAIWIALAAVIHLSFGWNVGLPIAFLASAPLTWGAARLSPRGAFWLLVVAGTAVSGLSLLGRGPFALGVLPADISILMVQVFVVTSAIVSLTVVVLTSKGRRLAATLHESEALFRGMFDFSPVGSVIVTRTPAGPTVSEMNAAGRKLLRSPADTPIVVSDHLSEESLAVLAGILEADPENAESSWHGVMTMRDDRTFDVLMTRLPSDPDGNTFTARFFDVTAELRAQRAAEDDLARAGEVQRALLPREASPLAGYDVAGANVPARAVGGDFYDWYRIEGGLALSLGDVMGKGVGAGMIAATTRAALRSARRDRDVGAAVARAADTLTTEIGDLVSFTTLFHARLSAADGSIRYVDAGHGLAIILRADGTAHRLASTDVPLGIDPDTAWTTHTETLDPGDALIAVSDGVLDLYDGTLAALDRVADLGRSAASAGELAGTLAGLARARSEPEDDSTVLVIRRHREAGRGGVA